MLLFATTFLVFQAAAPASAFSELIRAELAFAALARQQSTRTAFLANLHPQATIFQPGPINGRAYWEAQPENPGLLTWYPSFGEVSEDGRLGYTSGPAEYRRDRNHPEAPPNWKGRFVSVWRKGPDGTWRLVFDAGDDQTLLEPSLTTESAPRPGAPAGPSPAQEALFLESDRPHLPTLGDLAYVIEDRRAFGVAEPPAGRACLRIWKKVQGVWRLRALLESSHP